MSRPQFIDVFVLIGVFVTVLAELNSDPTWQTPIDTLQAKIERLEDRGLVRHKGNYWALGEDDDVAAYTSMLESTRAANDRFGEEDIDEWLEHAVDDEETE